MQLYPHWLDGEFVRIASNATAPVQDVREMLRALKLHALLGTEFVLNDVQVFDSAAVLALFADPAAREFLRRDRRFLDLRVEPDPNLGDHPFALAARGLTRTRAPGWSSSVFMRDSTPIKRLADEIIDEVQREQFVQLERPSRTARAYSEYAMLLNAARHAVAYFGLHDAPQKLVARPGQRTNYYAVLCNSLHSINQRIDELSAIPDSVRSILLAQAHEDLAHVDDTVRFIDQHIEEPDQRQARSRVLAILDREGDAMRRERIWNNVVQAWNYATEQTLSPQGGSVGTLPGAVSPAPYLESATDILVPVDVDKLEAPIAGVPNLPALPINVDEIKWETIGEIRDRTRDTMEELAQARRNRSLEADLDPLRKHLGAVARVLHPPKQISKLPYVVKIAGPVASTAVAVFGGPPVADYLRIITPAAIGLATSLVADLWGQTEPWRQRRALTTTLFRAASGRSK